MLEGVLVNETIEGLFQGTGDSARAARARTITQARGPLIGKALHLCAEGRIRKVERRRNRVDMVASHNLPESLRATKDARLLGLLEYGL